MAFRFNTTKFIKRVYDTLWVACIIGIMVGGALLATPMQEAEAAFTCIATAFIVALVVFFGAFGRYAVDALLEEYKKHPY